MDLPDDIKDNIHNLLQLVNSDENLKNKLSDEVLNKLSDLIKRADTEEIRDFLHKYL